MQEVVPYFSSERPFPSDNLPGHQHRSVDLPTPFYYSVGEVFASELEGLRHTYSV